MAQATPFLRICRLLLRVVFILVFRVKIEGRENWPAGTVIVALNHLGWTDPFLPLLFLPIEPRIYVLGERQVMHRSKLRYWFITHTRIMVPLDRGEPRQALRIMEETLRRGGGLLIFPEGKLGYVEGQLQPLQNGAARLSVATSLPIVPIGLTGTSSLWLRKTLTLRIGVPLRPEASETATDRERTSGLTAKLQSNLEGLLPGERDKSRVKLLKKWLTDLL